MGVTVVIAGVVAVTSWGDISYIQAYRATLTTAGRLPTAQTYSKEGYLTIST